MTLAEQVCALDPPPGRVGREVIYAAAVLLDLARRNLVRMDGARLAPVNGHPSDPLLSEVHSIITSSDRFRSPQHWVHWIPAALRESGDTLSMRVRRGPVAARSVSDVLGAGDPSVDETLLVALLWSSAALQVDDATLRTWAESLSLAVRRGELAGVPPAQAAVHAAVLVALTPVITTHSI